MTSKLTRERVVALIAEHSYDSALVDALEHLLSTMDSEPAIPDCDLEVYEKGVSVCLVAIPKETAEIICQNITAATGCKVDWHYFGGRVHIKALRESSQPAPVVPEEITIETATIIAYGLPTTNIGAIFKAGHDACRAAMLQAYPVCTCPSGDGSLRWPCPVHPGNSPAQSDCCPAQNGVNPEQKSLTPAQDGNHLVIP
ncbi:TPA: hypothetical protein ACTXCD_005557, partial [Klebsiella quasipneumoniae subsp. similipneumoniae]